MSCIYNQGEGNCQLWEPDYEMPGCDENGYCVVDNDPCPYDSCEAFEPDDPSEEFDCDDDLPLWTEDPDKKLAQELDHAEEYENGEW